MPSIDFVLSVNAVHTRLKHLNAAKHLHTHAHISSALPPLPASLLTVLPNPPPPPRLCLSFFLRRRFILQLPHPLHRAGPVPVAAHRRTASLVLPQVKSPTPQGVTHLTSPHPPPRASPLTGCEPGSGAELGVTNTSSFSH